MKRVYFAKGLNFAIPPDKLKFSDILLPFELRYCKIQNLYVPNQMKQLFKARLKDSALSLVNSHSKTVNL